MKQGSLVLGGSTKRTRKREFLDAMDRVVPWAELVALIEPFAPEAGRRGQQPFGFEALLRIHFMQQWFNLSDPAMEEALHDVPVFRDFAGLSNWGDALPSDSSILRFRRLLEQHKLAEQILATVNDLLSGQGPCCSRPARWWTPRSLPRPAPPRTRTARETPRCTRARRATNGTSG